MCYNKYNKGGQTNEIKSFGDFDGGLVITSFIEGKISYDAEQIAQS